jgi:hypothetical protein
MWGSFDNFIKNGGFDLMKLPERKFGQNLVDLAHAAAHLGVEVVLDVIVSAR